MRALSRYITILCLFAAVVVGCSKDSPTGSSAGAISGKVIDALTQAPLDSVTISTIPVTQTVKSDTGGNFTMPVVGAGTYMVNASRSGYMTASISVTVNSGEIRNVVIPMVVGSDGGDSLPAPSNPTPPDGALGQPTYLTLQWTAGSAADSLRYDVYFGTNAAPELTATDITTRSLLRTGLDTGKVYYWRVVVKNKKGQQKSGPVWSFKTTTLLNNNPPMVPYEPTPPNGASSQPYTLTLRWKCSDPDGDPLKYDVLFGTDAVPSTPVATDLTATSFQVTNLQQNATYHWRVVAKDNHNGFTSSPVWSFTMKTNLAPNAPNSPTPVNGAVDQSIAPTLRWNASDDDADKLTFDIYFGTTNPPTDLIVADHPNTSFAPPALSGGTTYFWRVVAKDGNGGVTSGPVWSFTTGTAAATGMVAYYPFNGNANDESGHGHDGAVMGATLTSDRFGNSGQAYMFGQNKYITVPHSSDLTMAQNNFTVAAWVNLSGSQSDYAGIVVKCTPTWPEKGYQLIIRSAGEGADDMLGGQYGTTVPDTSTVYFDVVGTVVPRGNWHFVAMVINRSTRTVSLYLDGVKQTSVEDYHLTYSMNNTMPLLIGVERQKKRFFQGAIDDVRIYNYALTDSEIQALANQ